VLKADNRNEIVFFSVLTRSLGIRSSRVFLSECVYGLSGQLPSLLSNRLSRLQNPADGVNFRVIS
jgi:hypothetical protein